MTLLYIVKYRIPDTVKIYIYGIFYVHINYTKKNVILREHINFTLPSQNVGQKFAIRKLHKLRKVSMY